jgi:hypothetical protein
MVADPFRCLRDTAGVSVEAATKEYLFFIDVFSYCNLRCPTCIVGNKFGDIHAWPKGLMSAELLGRILDKGKSECRISHVGLYNWTEASFIPISRNWCGR